MQASSAEHPPTTARARGRLWATGARWPAAIGALAVLAACGTSSTGNGAAGTTPAAASVTCDYVPDGQAAKQVGPPSADEPAGGAALAGIALTSGTVQVELDRTAAPCTVGSFVHLAESGYFDNTPCHRMTASSTLHILQCGDPSGSGSGGPGYTFADETDAEMVYPAGTLAMANAGPNTNGSQFFLVYEDSTLPPDYTVFGIITQGIDVLRDIAAKGITGSGNATAPVRPVTISSVRIAE